MKRLVLFLIIFGFLPAAAQPKVFSADELIAVVAKYHPVARQALIQLDVAKAGILSGRAGFDPQLTIKTGRKEFGGIAYYDYRESEIRVPTWYGIDLFAGVENITGARINPEETTGSVTHIGFSIQPLQNLLMDKRRAAILQARNLYQLSEVQRRLIVNDLLYESLTSYWDWWEKFHVHRIVDAALRNAEERLALVKTAFRLGDRPAIDTIEAYAQVQAFQVSLLEAAQDLAIARLQLSAYLWTDNDMQIELPTDVVPGDYEVAGSLTLAEMLNVTNAHPELVQYDYKLKGLQIDRKLAIQALLPNVQLKYNQLGYDLGNTLKSPWFENNYRYGVSVSIPLRLSEGRGELQRAKLSMESTRLDMTNKRVQLLTRVKQYFVEWRQAEAQVSVQDKLLKNANVLQKGEEVRFSNGESSLFLVNSREVKRIEAEQKLIELKVKSQKAALGIRWSAGVLAI